MSNKCIIFLMNEQRTRVLFSLQLLKNLDEITEGTTWLQCKSYYKTHYVRTDTSGNLSKKRRQFVNSFSTKRFFSLPNPSSKATAPPPLASSAAYITGWKGQR